MSATDKNWRTVAGNDAVQAMRNQGLTDEQIEKIIKGNIRNHEELENNPQYELHRVRNQVIPSSWRNLTSEIDGEAWVHQDGLRCILSVAKEGDGQWWIHASGSRQGRMPSYKDMMRIRREFLPDEHDAIQVFPSRERHININPNVLHLWMCLTASVLPDFSNGTGSI